MAFREKIKYIRKRKLKLNQREFAKAAGVSLGTVRSWEQGLTEASSTTRKKLCGRMGIPEAELLSSPPPPDGLVEKIFIGKHQIPKNLPEDLLEALNDPKMVTLFSAIARAKKQYNNDAVEICNQITTLPKERTAAIKKAIFN